MSLLEQVKKVYDESSKNGGLKTIKTKELREKFDGQEFSIRVAVNTSVIKPTNLEKHVQHEKDTIKEVKNCFRPYDDSCFVCEIKPKYCLLLNKFNVLENHLLLITKPFEPQTDHLNLQDFTAIFDLLKQLETKDQDWVVFYNRGVYSGASQPHKHFQIIGGKDAQGNYIFPILNKLAKHARDGKETVTEYPFLHSFSPLKNTDPKAVFSTYESLLKRVNVYNSKPSVDEKEEKMIIICEGPGLKETEKYEFSLSPSKYPSYNLLFTKSWMLVIPRRAENYNKISVNSLGFLFSLFAKTQEDLQKIRDVGAMKLLREVTFPQNK